MLLLHFQCWGDMEDVPAGTYLKHFWLLPYVAGYCPETAILKNQYLIRKEFMIIIHTDFFRLIN